MENINTFMGNIEADDVSYDDEGFVKSISTTTMTIVTPQKMYSPLIIESCMNPGEYKKIGLTIIFKKDSKEITIRQMNEIYRLDADKTSVKLKKFVPQFTKAGFRCANCINCGRC